MIKITIKDNNLAEIIIIKEAINSNNKIIIMIKNKSVNIFSKEDVNLGSFIINVLYENMYIQYVWKFYGSLFYGICME